MEETIKALASQVEHLQKLYDWQVMENQRLREALIHIININGSHSDMDIEFARQLARDALKESE